MTGLVDVIQAHGKLDKNSLFLIKMMIILCHESKVNKNLIFSTMKCKQNLMFSSKSSPLFSSKSSPLFSSRSSSINFVVVCC